MYYYYNADMAAKFVESVGKSDGVQEHLSRK